MGIKSRITKVAAVPLVASVMLVGGLGIAGTASADGGRGGGTPAPQGVQTPRPGPVQGQATAAVQAWVAPSWLTSDLEAAAAAQIGITKAQLTSETARGRTIAQVAAQHGSSFSVIKTTLVNVGDADLQKATAAGRVTQNDANQIVSTIPQLMEQFLNRSSGRAGGPGSGAFNRAPGGAPAGQHNGNAQPVPNRPMPGR